MTGKFHPRFKQAHKSHRARTERDVKLPTAPFYVGQCLTVIERDRNTIVVEFFDGRANTITCRLEVCADDQEDEDLRHINEIDPTGLKARGFTDQEIEEFLRETGGDE